ncbi:MAG: hypothetical protein QXN05_02090 [Acidilobaceae archaeon]
MAARVLEEVLSYRSRAHPVLSSKWFLVTKALLLAFAMLAPLLAPLPLALALLAFTMLLLLALGLRASIAYVVMSTAFVISSSVVLAVLFKGDPIAAFRFGLSAGSSLAVALFVFATTKPSAFRALPALYVSLIIIDGVLRETLDVYVSLKARGLESWRLYVAVTVDSVLRSFVRSEALIDSLKARGLEIQ